MTDLRTMLERGVGGATPPPDGFERMLRRRDRKRRNKRIAAGVIGIAVFVAAVWVVTSGGPAKRTPTPGGTGPTAAPEYPGQVGIVGLPPKDAIASSPSHGELVVGFSFGHSGGDPGRFGLHVYADGRLIWEKLGDFPGGDPTATGLIEQHLTPEGVELIRSEVLSTGLFDRDRHLVGGYLPYSGAIEVRDGDRLVRISWGDIGPQTGPETLATPEQANALEGLDTRLEDLASWLPASAWEDQELRAYVASRYSLCLETGRDVQLARVLGSLPRPAEDTLRAWDLTYREDANPDPPAPWYLWCSAVTTDQARSLAGVLEDADVRSNGGDVFGLVFIAEPRDPDAVNVSISFGPLLPHEISDDGSSER